MNVLRQPSFSTDARDVRPPRREVWQPLDPEHCDLRPRGRPSGRDDAPPPAPSPAGGEQR